MLKMRINSSMLHTVEHFKLIKKLVFNIKIVLYRYCISYMDQLKLDLVFVDLSFTQYVLIQHMFFPLLVAINLTPRVVLLTRLELNVGSHHYSSRVLSCSHLFRLFTPLLPSFVYWIVGIVCSQAYLKTGFYYWGCHRH